MSDDLVRSAKVAQWGNSAAVRIGAAALSRAGLGVDDAVDVIARPGEIVIRRQQPKVTMAELLARFDPEQHRREVVLDVPPQGIETP